MENYYYHDGEQLGFYKKSTYQNAELEEGCSCNLDIVRNEWIPIYFTKTALKGTLNCIFNMEKVDSEES